MKKTFDNSTDDVLPSGSGTSTSQQHSTSIIIQSEEDIINELTSLSKEISSGETRNIPDSGLKLKDPPDLNEILQADEALITPTSHNVGILNSACQLVLKEMEYQLLKLLKQNRKEQETVLGFLNSKGKIQDLDSGKKNASFKCSGIPYFKDSNGFFPPDNEDVVMKKKNNELLPFDFIDVAPTWNLSDTKTLIKAVKSFQNFEDCNSIDWLKISATHMNGKFSAVECKSKWLLHLKPDVNRSKWGIKESSMLEKIAKKYNYQDWDSISKELGTNRTGLQCCARFHSQKVSNSGKRWSKEEDEELKRLIDKFKMKDHIPWAKVAWHFESRSLRQCQERFDYHLGNIKKGVFTVEEDFVLVYLATKLKNFGEVAKYLPNRASTQVRARYEYLVKMSMPKFTKEEDELLTKLMIQYPRNWAKISEYFQNRSKLQCRRRWLELQKNINLDNEDVSDKEEELQLYDNSNNTNSDLKIDEDLYLKSFPYVSKAKVNKTYSGEYKKLLQYHNHCHKFLFGPKPRLPTSVEESKKCSKTLKKIMSNLSINPCVPLDTFDIKLLPSNCEFDSEDVFLLKHINDLKEVRKEVKVSDKIIPPNYITLVGLRSLLLTRNKMKELSKAYEPPETISNNNINPESRLLFTDAKKLFKARMKALFAYPLMLSHISQDGVEVKPVHKPKVRKGVKKMSKLRRKEHAKLMNQAYRRQKKLNEQLVKSGELRKSDDDEESNLKYSEAITQSMKKRKAKRKPKCEEKKEEPEAKKPRRSLRITSKQDN